MKNKNASRRTPTITLTEMCVFAMLGALMFASKKLMEAIPNVHLVGFFIVVTTVIFRTKALIPLYIYIFLDGLFGGGPFSDNRHENRRVVLLSLFRRSLYGRKILGRRRHLPFGLLGILRKRRSDGQCDRHQTEQYFFHHHSFLARFRAITGKPGSRAPAVTIAPYAGDCAFRSLTASSGVST